VPTWFWLNVPACALIFTAVAGMPLWMVLKRPEEHRSPDLRPGPGECAPASRPDPPGRPETDRIRPPRLGMPAARTAPMQLQPAQDERQAR
jgi:hypothetical protein